MKLKAMTAEIDLEDTILEIEMAGEDVDQSPDCFFER